MNFGFRSWLVAFVIASLLHLTFFFNMRTEPASLVERASGPQISMMGAKTFAEIDRKIESTVDAQKADAEPVKEEAVEPEVTKEPEPEPKVEKAVETKPEPPTKPEPIRKAEVTPQALNIPKLAPLQSGTPLLKSEEVKKEAPSKPQDQKPVKKKIEPIKRSEPSKKEAEKAKPKKTEPKQKKEKLQKKPKQKKVEQKKPKKKPKRKEQKKAKKKTRQKKKSQQASRRSGKRVAALTQGGGAKGRQNKVAGRATLTNYQGAVNAHLARFKKRQRSKGTARLVISFVSSGRVVSVRVVKSSGSKVLDKAAVDMVRRASPLPPIPRSLGRKKLKITKNIVFRN